jgi:putative nucleotidyltransferase with HDIG domain
MPLRSQALIAGEVVLLCVSVAVAIAVSSPEAWEPIGLFFVLLALAIGSDMLAMRHKHQRISGAFLALVLAMALLGPAPAAAIGVISTLVDHVRSRNPLPRLITNLATYATFPLVGGLLIEWAGARGWTDNEATFALLVFVAFMISNLLNFLGIAGDYAFHNRVSLAQQFRTIFLPVLPSEVASALLTVTVAVVYRQIGLAALGLLAIVLVMFQYLLGELLLSQNRAEELERRTRQLAALQLGVLATMVETLALRDRMTARHSAAVARYAREMAIACGRPREEQELVHTAGLLHDIGKFAFPDSILLADQRLGDDDWALVKRHPADGARVVREVEGYGPVADIILCHHERWDGTGYPGGVKAEEIPLLSRMISVADTYDVLTARDSYRRPMPAEQAVAELRRSAGGQLDADLVELFVSLLDTKGLNFGHADDADFEAELEFERRVREYAQPRKALVR